MSNAEFIDVRSYSIDNAITIRTNFSFDKHFKVTFSEPHDQKHVACALRELADMIQRDVSK